MARTDRLRGKSLREPGCGGIVPPHDSPLPSDVPPMTVFSTRALCRARLARTRPSASDRAGDRPLPPAPSPSSPICYGRPGGPNGSNGPERLPVSVGNTLFNVPVAAIRMKIQRHSGPQERIDLNFSYPSLEPPDAPRHVSADTVEEEMTQPIDRIFLSIAAHQNSLSPELRVQNDLSALSRAG